MNRYTPCGGFIIAANDEKFAVETPHQLPLPEGIDSESNQPNGRACAILFSDGPEWSMCHRNRATHWLARRPLPEVPKVKTQEEKDSEWISAEWLKYQKDSRGPVQFLRDTIAYARQCPAKPAA